MTSPTCTAPLDLALCSTCNSFDVRALLLATEDQQPQQIIFGDGWYRKNKRGKDALPRFFRHLPDLQSLKSSASSCDLCAAIWDSYSKKVGTQELTNEALKSGLDMMPIWMGRSPYDSHLNGLPCVTVTQFSGSGQWRNLAYFEVVAQRGQEPADAQDLLATSIFPYSGSYECLAVCRRWLEECYEHHKDCQIERHTGDRLPTRVIDVATSDINGMPCPRLVDGKGRSEKFAALSYCWGGESILTLNAQTEAELRAGLPMEQFPPTLRDAIIVTQHLRLKYLWIDAVCIKQDSAEDWNIEATKMRDIYKGAIVTIAAAAASKSSDGIFRHRTVGRTLCKLPWLNGESPCPTVSLRSGSEIRQDPARSSLIHTRAWTLQETLLAPRTLYLGSHIITFECSQGQIDESGRSTKSTENYRNKSHIQTMYRDISRKSLYKAFRTLGIPHVVNILYPSLSLVRNRRGMAIRAFSHYGLETFQTFLTGYTFFTQGLVTTPGGLSMTYYDLWREIITQYSKRHLTKVSDTLPALAGLANDFNHVTGDKYFAGLWMGDIIRSLCWMTFPGGNSAKNTRHVNEYLAPSWSWASVYGLPLGFYGHESTEDSGFKPLAEVIGIRAAPAGQDPFGRVVDGELVLRAHFLAIDLAIESPLLPQSPKIASPGMLEGVQFEITRRQEFHNKHISHESQTFGLLKIASMKARGSRVKGVMMLVETTGDGRWRRVGCVPTTLWKNNDYLVEAIEQTERSQAREWKSAPWVRRTLHII